MVVPTRPLPSSSVPSLAAVPDLGVSPTRPTPLLAAKFNSRNADSSRLRLLDGFPRVARFIAADPDKTLMIVRRFDEASIRNLLLLEGRVAALEAVQKRLDEHDFQVQRTSDVVTEICESWESFALLGSASSDSWRLPEAAVEQWCEDRAVALRAELYNLESATAPEHSTRIEHLKAVLRRRQALTADLVRVESAIRDVASSSTPEVYSKTSRTLFKERMHILHMQQSIMRTCEPDLFHVRRRWEISQALQLAIEDYQKAVLRYRDMLKLEAPDTHSDSVLGSWIQGVAQSDDVVKATGNDRPYKPQFSPFSSMDKVYASTSPASTKFFRHLWVSSSDSHDRVCIGRVAASDSLSALVSRAEFNVRFTKVSFLSSYTGLYLLHQTDNTECEPRLPRDKIHLREGD